MNCSKLKVLLATSIPDYAEEVTVLDRYIFFDMPKSWVPVSRDIDRVDPTQLVGEQYKYDVTRWRFRIRDV